MKTQENTNETKAAPTAAQRIENLERSAMQLNQGFLNLTRQVQTIQDSILALNDKLVSMSILLEKGMPVNDENIDQINTQRKVEEMKEKVNLLLDQKVMEKSEEVTKNSFLVVREVDDSDGKVINPRLQFVARALSKKEDMDKVLGKKVGDTVKFIENDSRTIEIEEIYEIKQGSGNQGQEAQAQQ